MCKQSQSRSATAHRSALSGWSIAIVEAERQITAAEQKIRNLRASIQTFNDMRARKEPFPGETDLLSQDSDL